MFEDGSSPGGGAYPVAFLYISASLYNEKIVMFLYIVIKQYDRIDLREAPPRGELSDRAVAFVRRVNKMRMTERGCSNKWLKIQS